MARLLQNSMLYLVTFSIDASEGCARPSHSSSLHFAPMFQCCRCVMQACTSSGGAAGGFCDDATLEDFLSAMNEEDDADTRDVAAFFAAAEINDSLGGPGVHSGAKMQRVTSDPGGLLNLAPECQLLPRAAQKKDLQQLPQQHGQQQGQQRHTQQTATQFGYGPQRQQVEEQPQVQSCQSWQSQQQVGPGQQQAAQWRHEQEHSQHAEHQRQQQELFSQQLQQQQHLKEQQEQRFVHEQQQLLQQQHFEQQMLQTSQQQQAKQAYDRHQVHQRMQQDQMQQYHRQQQQQQQQQQASHEWQPLQQQQQQRQQSNQQQVHDAHNMQQHDSWSDHRLWVQHQQSALNGSRAGGQNFATPQHTQPPPGLQSHQQQQHRASASPQGSGSGGNVPVTGGGVQHVNNTMTGADGTRIPSNSVQAVSSRSGNGRCASVASNRMVQCMCGWANVIHSLLANGPGMPCELVGAASAVRMLAHRFLAMLRQQSPCAAFSAVHPNSQHGRDCQVMRTMACTVPCNIHHSFCQTSNTLPFLTGTPHHMAAAAWDPTA